MNIIMRFPNGKAKALTLSFDDGVETDIKLIEIMNKHGLKGTFNINSGCFAPEGTVYPKGTIHRRMSKKQCYELYKDCGQEVAAHGYTHPKYIDIPASLIMEDILKDRQELEKMFGKLIRGFAYPFGDCTEDAIKCLKCCNIVYARAVRSTEDFGIPENWLALEPTCHYNNPRLDEITDRFLEIDCNHFTTSKLFYLWGHSYEFDQHNNWNIIENFAEKIGGREDIWYATNIEIYDYIADYKKLQFSADGSFVYNPTLTDIFMEVSGKIVEVKSAETVRLI